jgi:hypothetical protein
MMKSRDSEALSSFQNWAEGTPLEVSSFSTWAIHPHTSPPDRTRPSGDSYSPERWFPHVPVPFHDTEQPKPVFRGDAVWPVLWHTCGVAFVVEVDF